MPINSRTLARIATLRVSIDRLVDAATRDLVRAWGRAWQEIVVEWQAAVTELLASAPGEDEWLARRLILRAEKAQAALTVTAGKLEELGRLAGVRVEKDLPALAEAVLDAMDDLVTSQLPKGFTVSWTRVPADELDWMVRRTTQQITSTLWPLSADTQAAMRSVLIRGVMVGDNPRSAARLLLRRLQVAFNGGQARAVNIMRTEMLDATRSAALASRQRNRDVLAGWRWQATLSARTCPSCLAMHGTLHDIDEPGPYDHQSGRCVGVPVVKPWRELGIDQDEPADRLPDGQKWFDRQPAAVQKEILGPGRYAAYKRGDMAWADMAVRRSTPGWRDSYVPAPVPR